MRDPASAEAIRNFNLFVQQSQDITDSFMYFDIGLPRRLATGRGVR